MEFYFDLRTTVRQPIAMHLIKYTEEETTESKCELFLVSKQLLLTIHSWHNHNHNTTRLTHSFHSCICLFWKWSAGTVEDRRVSSIQIFLELRELHSRLLCYAIHGYATSNYHIITTEYSIAYQSYNVDNGKLHTPIN
jgi:hypothetical protein